MLQKEWHVVGADLQHQAGARAAIALLQPKPESMKPA